MFESKDILNYTIAFVVLWIGLFIGWSLYYVTMMLRQANLTIKEAREKLKMIDSLLKVIKNKLESSTTHLALLVEGVREIIKFVDVTKEKRSAKKTARDKKPKVSTNV